MAEVPGTNSVLVSYHYSLSPPNWAEHSRAQAADARATIDARSASMVNGTRGARGRYDGRDGEHPKTVVARKTCAVGVSRKATSGDRFRKGKCEVGDNPGSCLGWREPGGGGEGGSDHVDPLNLRVE